MTLGTEPKSAHDYNPADQHSVQLERIERRLSVIQRYLEKDPNALRDLAADMIATLKRDVTAEAIRLQETELRQMVRDEIESGRIFFQAQPWR